MADEKDERRIEAGVVVADRFLLEHELGRGGMGSVWRAQHLSLEVPCAVKFILDERTDDPTQRGRFSHEARAAAKLRCPNVVQILDHGVWARTPYIAMELLEGETLTRRLDRVGALSLAETREIVEGVAEALTHAERLGIVHRDLKPDNVFMAREGDRERVKVLDFGVAKLAAEPNVAIRTASGALIGTPHYMSPEQTHGGKSVDHRSDLWSLAVIAFECITGRAPFDGSGLGELIQAIMSGPLPMPSQFLAGCAPELDAWWTKAAARDPADRFQSARELAAAFRAVAAGDSIPASPSPRSSADDRTLEAPIDTVAAVRTFDGERAAEHSPRRSLLVAVLVASLAGAALFIGFVVARSPGRTFGAKGDDTAEAARAPEDSTPTPLTRPAASAAPARSVSSAASTSSSAPRREHQPPTRRVGKPRGARLEPGY